MREVKRSGSSTGWTESSEVWPVGCSEGSVKDPEQVAVTKDRQKIRVEVWNARV